MDELSVPEIVELTPDTPPRGDGWLGRSPLGSAGIRWALSLGAIVIVGAVIAGVRWGPFASVSSDQTPSTAPSVRGLAAETVADLLGHLWERPYAVTPDLPQWGSGYLRIDSARLELRPARDAPPSTSLVMAAGGDSLVVTATAETAGCTLGDRGTYLFIVEGEGSVLTLTASESDACAAREGALAGMWVRADFPPRGQWGVSVAPGTHRTMSFDPFGGTAPSGHLTYTIPTGWELIEDSQAAFVLHRTPGAEAFVILIAEPLVSAEFEEGAICGPFTAVSGVGQRPGDIMSAITSRPGVVSTSPAMMAIGGYAAKMIDLHVATSWTGGCQTPGEGWIVAVPLLQASSGLGPQVGVSEDAGPLRLVLLDLGNGRTLAIAISFVDPQASLDQQVATIMPIIESFEFRSQAP